MWYVNKKQIYSIRPFSIPIPKWKYENEHTYFYLVGGNVTFQIGLPMFCQCCLAYGNESKGEICKKTTNQKKIRISHTYIFGLGGGWSQNFLKKLMGRIALAFFISVIQGIRPIRLHKSF